MKIDSAGPVRKGEELDEKKLEIYLREKIPDAHGPFELRQFPGGHSNLTYLVNFGDSEFVLRRPPFGSRVKSAHDMNREFTVLSRLTEDFPPAPSPLLYCDDHEIIGVDFYLMERIQGVVLRNQAPHGVDFPEETVRGCCESFVRNLAALHSIDYEEVGLASLRREGQYTERQVKGWAKRYVDSQTDDIQDVEEVSNWLSERIPLDSGAAVIHNDYKFDNLVLDQTDITRIAGVLDWEMATIGDPLMDLGTSLGYWAEDDDEEEIKIVQSFLTTLPGAFNRTELAERYSQLSGTAIPDLSFYYVFSLFKLAVIVQQIYYRYAKGLTQDPRFATMIDMVRALGRKAVKTIELERV